MMRAAIYARVSTDKQNEDSCADQVTWCREYAKRQGWEVAGVWEDQGISGADPQRPGLEAALDAMEGWDVLLVWDESRVARDGEIMGAIRRRLRAARKKGVSTKTGLDFENVGSKVMGVMAEEYRRQLAFDTHRGLRGRATRGFAAGGLPFGYRSEKEKGGARICVVPEQAAIVCEVFELYVAGKGIKAVAHELNVRGVPSPRPRRNAKRKRSWAPSAIHAMLGNPLYRAELIWNRSTWIEDVVDDPVSGRRRKVRRRHERPESEWVRVHDEAWRIVSDAVWHEAQRVRKARNRTAVRGEDGCFRVTAGRAQATGRRGRQLLAGFLECGECGGGFYSTSARGRWRCAWRQDRGASVCGNDHAVRGADLEAGLVRELSRRILTPENVEYALERAMEHACSLLAADEPGRLQKDLCELDGKIERATDLYIERGTKALRDRLEALEAARAAVADRLLALGAGSVDTTALRPRIEAKLRDLRAALGADPVLGRRVLGALLGDERLRVSRGAKPGSVRIEGTLSIALNENPGPRRGEVRDRVVAGARFEPTCGLRARRAFRLLQPAIKQVPSRGSRTCFMDLPSACSYSSR